MLDNLSEILLATTSHPLMTLSRSIKSHRIPNSIYLITLKRKLFLPIFPSSNLPNCVCGATIDEQGEHIFNCRRVSKWKWKRDGGAKVIHHIMSSAAIVNKSSSPKIEPQRIIENVDNCRPFDFSVTPVVDLSLTDVAPCPYTEIGFDVTISRSKSHTPASQRNASSHQSASAVDKHLREKERVKLRQQGMKDNNGHVVTGEDMIGRLLDSNKVLIPMAISPYAYGRWGPMFHAFLFGGQDEPCLRFHQASANAARMYHRARSPAAQGGIIPRASSRWRATKAKEQHFYGSSWSTPTPTEYVYQRLGLVIITALAQHLRDAMRGELATAPSTHAPPEPPPGFDSSPSHVPPVACGSTAPHPP